jgi:hypothetical protein
MNVYYATDYKVLKVYSDLQKQRTNDNNYPNFLSCPAVRDGWHNVFMFTPKQKSKITYDKNFVTRTKDLPVIQFRKPHLTNTNIFNLDSSSYFFCEEPLKMKVTAPYFHNVSYQSKGTFIGGVFDIGRWFRPIQSEIITWQEKGIIEFGENEPLFYVEFLTDKTVSLQEFNLTPSIDFFSSSLVNSPFQNKETLQGSLESRYRAFEQSDFRLGLLEAIKANLVSEDSASHTV